MTNRIHVSGLFSEAVRWRALAAFCLLLMAYCLPARAQESDCGKAEAWGQLRVTVVDHDSGKPVAARCYLTDPMGQFWSPAGAINYIRLPERNFVTLGEFRIALPPRTYTLVVERGPEYQGVTREIAMSAGEAREETVELGRWINMNARGWYSGDLHNHRDWQEISSLLLANDLNLATTLTEWIWENAPNSRAPESHDGKPPAIHEVDATHAYSIFDTEIERLQDGPGAVDLVGLRAPVAFHGYLVYPPNTEFTAAAHRLGGYVDAEKISWRDGAALVALGQVDFAGLVHNHFNRHGVETDTAGWGMIPKQKPEYDTPAGMALWTMETYYRLLNCGFKLPVSGGSASGVKPSPLGFDRVYAHLTGKFSYADWFRTLKAGRSFATNGPMLFLTVNGREPGGLVVIPEGKPGKPSPTTGKLQVHVEAGSSHELDRVEVVWKGRILKTLAPANDPTRASGEFEFDPDDTGWLAARAFERPAPAIRFAETSPVYVQRGSSRGLVPEDAKYFVGLMDQGLKFYQNYPGFRSEADRQAMLEVFRRARGVYERLATARGATLTEPALAKP